MNKFNFSRPIPLLILGDAPDLPSGLGRIGHDLAWLFSTMPEFRIGYLGREGFGRAKYPWTQYNFPAADQWGETRIREAWQDLSAGEYGVILTIWDASRLLWFTHPLEMPAPTRAFLESDAFERWGYFMVDGSGVDPTRLPAEQTAVMSRYRRILTASQWGHGLAKASLPDHPDLNWLPHPINRTTFCQQDRGTARSFWGIGDRDPLVGCVMTNQQRKHWPVVMETIAQMPGVRLWLHTDRMLGYWNLHALAIEYSMADRIVTDGRPLSDKDLAVRYSACDATVLISGGEGFGYPVAESLSCGVPVVTGAYGAQAELVLPEMLLHPVTTQIETSHNVRRAIYNAPVPAMGQNTLAYTLARVRTRDWQAEQAVERVAHLDMPKLGLLFQKWARKGIE